MRFIEIDGKVLYVTNCDECPCYESDSGGRGYCKHPTGEYNNGAEDGGRYMLDSKTHEELWDDEVPEQYRFGRNCPLRSKEVSHVR